MTLAGVKITEEPNPFLPETRVRVKATGKVGTVRGSFGYGYNIRHDDGTYWVYTEAELEVIPGVQ